MKRKLRLLHKYLSLTVAALWLMQALTGALLVFHWELDDWAVAGPQRHLDPVRFGAFLENLQATHSRQTVKSVYASGGLPGRFDVLMSDPGGATDVLRVDGEGAVLRQRPWDHDYGHIGWLQFATYLHQTLFMHTAGNWLIGLSGVLLLSNIVLGLSLAWPRAREWARALMPVRAGAPAAKVYSWHRAIGLWLAIPALLLVSAGTIRAYDDPLADHFEDTRPAPTEATVAAEPASAGASVAEALSTALHLYPGSTLAALELPGAHAPWFAVRVRQAQDLRRVFGTTIVYVSSRSGRVLGNYDARSTPLKTRLWDAVYALHTGEIGGIVGRCLVAIVGMWLSVMIGLGLSLWFLRRRVTSALRTDSGTR